MQPFFVRFCVVIGLFFVASQAKADVVRVLVLDLAKLAIEQVLPSFEKQYGHQVIADYASAERLTARIEGGEAVDVIILDAASLDRLEKSRKLRNLEIAELGRTGLGVAVKAGGPIPAVFTEDEFKASLLSAQAIAYADPASGSPGAIQFHSALAKIGLGAKLTSKLRVLPQPEAVRQAIAGGEIDLGVGMASEFVNRPGIAFAGFLPHALQRWTIVRAMRVSDGEPARAFLDHIADDDNLKLLARGGFR